MPKELTHFTIADKAYKKLSDNALCRAIIEKNYHAYLTGSVIMDSAFYTFYGHHKNNVFKSGGALHNTSPDSYDVIRKLFCDDGRKIEDDVIAFAMGIATHIHADSAFHPMVFYYSGTSLRKSVGEINAPRVRHQIIETYLDLYYRRECPGEGGKVASHISKWGIDGNRLSELMIKLLMHNVPFWNNVSKNEKKKAVTASLRSHKFIQGLFNVKPIRLMFCYLSAKPGLGLLPFMTMFYPYHQPDPVILFPRPITYRHPVTGISDKESIPEIENRAVSGVLSFFEDMEKWLEKGASSMPIFSKRGPGLITGNEIGTIKDLRYFDTENSVFDIIF